MILYFSGTGNSAYVAQRIGKELEDDITDLFEKIRSRDFSELYSDKPWVVVSPTYAWRIPRILEEWLMHTELKGRKDIYFVMTCGGSIGNAGVYIDKLCHAKGLRYRGCAEVVMPENYIAMFETPMPDEALAIINKAEVKIIEIIQLMRKETAFQQQSITWKDKIDSGIVNDMFYPLFVHAKKFYATDKCISCGKCERVCPLKNIQLKDGRPVWGRNCTHCMACICRCSAEAIEYGKHSIGMPRYICPEIKL